MLPAQRCSDSSQVAVHVGLASPQPPPLCPFLLSQGRQRAMDGGFQPLLNSAGEVGMCTGPLPGLSTTSPSGKSFTPPQSVHLQKREKQCHPFTGLRRRLNGLTSMNSQNKLKALVTKAQHRELVVSGSCHTAQQ